MKKIFSLLLTIALAITLASPVNAADPQHPTVFILSPAHNGTTSSFAPLVTISYSTVDYTEFTYEIDTYVSSCATPLSHYGTDSENAPNFRLPMLSAGTHRLTVCANSWGNNGINYSPKRVAIFTVVPPKLTRGGVSTQ